MVNSATYLSACNHKGISYDKSIGVVVVHYAREDAPGKVFKEKAGAFFNYIVVRQVQ